MNILLPVFKEIKLFSVLVYLEMERNFESVQIYLCVAGAILTWSESECDLFIS